MLGQLNFDGKDKVQVAIDRLLNAAELAGTAGLYVAFSGGKDSEVVYDLSIRSGVQFDAHYNMTGIDAPELVRFIRTEYSEVEMHRPITSIFKAIRTQGMPRRRGRWCCEVLKESKGSGRYIVTGIRWAESGRRKKRRALEVCTKDATKFYVNPIIDWSESEVWEYIRLRDLPYCSLYDEGFKRLGCVLCPMTTARITRLEAARWPKLAEGWRRAAYRYHAKGLPSTQRWATPEEFWQWWLSRGEEPVMDEAQCVMFGD
jgi:phosphoadenosine phosphosulfate reductase